MVPKVLACDFDGTLASAECVAPEAVAALRRARAAGVRLILVTARTFFELLRVCEPLDLFDAVVAENGAVTYWPGAAMIHDEGPPPPPRLLEELDRRGLVYQVGRVIVGLARGDEPAIRQALAASGVSRQITYDRGALMLLPAGIGKGKGVERVLAALGLSYHDALAVGAAENDAELFAACGLTSCPEDATADLRAHADWVFPGADGAAVAAAIDGPILGGRLDPGRRARHRVQIGWVTATSEPVTIPSRDVNVLIAGDTAAGKSWLAGALVERLLAERYSVCVIDPEGDYAVLSRLPGVRGLRAEAGGVEQLDEELRRGPFASVVLDLSGLAYERKLAVTERALGIVRDARRELGRPHWVVLDEAHYALHVTGVSEPAAALAGKGFCLVTYRPSWIRPGALDAVDVLILARITAPGEPGGAAGLDGTTIASAPLGLMLPALPPGEFMLIERRDPAAASVVTFVPVSRGTVHRRHRVKYACADVPSGCRFLFRGDDGVVVAEAGQIVQFSEALDAVPDPVLDGHARRGDFSRWVRDVLGDRELAAALRKIETRRAQGQLDDLRSALRHLVAVRYGPLAGT